MQTALNIDFPGYLEYTIIIFNGVSWVYGKNGHMKCDTDTDTRDKL